MIVLISVWPVFRSLPASGAFVRDASATSAGMSAVRFGAADRRIVFFERALEVLDGLVRRRLGHEDLGAAAPHHDEPIELVRRLEPPDVVGDLLGEVFLVLPFLDVRAVEPLDVMLVEHRRPRADFLEVRAHLVEQRRLDDAGGPRRGVAVVLEDVPAAEDEVVEPGQRHHLVDLRRASFGALAEAHGAHLRERPDWLRDALPNGENAGDRRGAHGAEADEHHAESAARRSNIDWRRHETAIISRSAFRCQPARRAALRWSDAADRASNHH